jgi:hypothetical protein
MVNRKSIIQDGNCVTEVKTSFRSTMLYVLVLAKSQKLKEESKGLEKGNPQGETVRSNRLRSCHSNESIDQLHEDYEEEIRETNFLISELDACVT